MFCCVFSVPSSFLRVPVSNRSLVCCFVFFVRLVLYSRLLFKAAEFLKRGILLCKFKANVRVLTHSVVFVCSGGRARWDRRLRFACLPAASPSFTLTLAPYPASLKPFPLLTLSPFSLYCARAWFVYNHCVNTVYV